MSRPKPLRLSDLSPTRQALVRLCQTINHGSIEDLEVRHSEPVFDPQPVVAIDLKLDTEQGAREETDLADFRLPPEIDRLMATFDDIGSGKIIRIEIRAGIPRRVVFEQRHSALLRLPGWPETPGANK